MSKLKKHSLSSMKLGPSLGDWTTCSFVSEDKALSKVEPVGFFGFDFFSKEELKILRFLHYRFVEQLLKKFISDMNIKIDLL